MDHSLENEKGFQVHKKVDKKVEGSPSAEVQQRLASEKKKATDKRSKDKKKAETEQMKKRLTELELSASKLNGRNEENEKELNHWRQLSTSLVTAVGQIASQSKLMIQLVQQSQQMSSLLGQILLQLPQLQQQPHHPYWSLDNLGTPNQENNPKPVQDLRHHQALQSPSMNILDNTDTGKPNLDDFSHGLFNLDDFIPQDDLQTYQLDSPQDHREESVNAKLLGHGNKSLGKKRATSSDDPVLHVDQSQFAKLPKLSHPSGFGNSYVGQQQQTIAQQQLMISELQQQQWLTQQMGLPKQGMINDDLAHGHTVTGADFQAQRDPTMPSSSQQQPVNGMSESGNEQSVPK